MPFRPQVNNHIEINNQRYFFPEHPSAKGMPYGQTGRRATVFQIVDETKESHALKIFTNAFRTPNTASQGILIDKYSYLPGLLACKRFVLTPEKNSDLLTNYPDLKYAVLMPWMRGNTWQEIVLSKKILSKSQSKNIALSFLNVLCSMEQEGIAHCDLSGPNLIINSGLVDKNVNNNGIYLIDLEDLYSPDLPPPEKKPGGSAGYAHKSSVNGIWSSNADRFAGSILLAEMLGWCDANIRDHAFGEQFFGLDELQTSCLRFNLLIESLNNNWGGPFAELFRKSWYSFTLQDCPTFSNWVDLFSEIIPLEIQKSKEGVNNTSVSSPVIGWRSISGERISHTSEINPVELPVFQKENDSVNVNNLDKIKNNPPISSIKSAYGEPPEIDWDDMQFGDYIDSETLNEEPLDFESDQSQIGEFFDDSPLNEKYLKKKTNTEILQDTDNNPESKKFVSSDPQNDKNLFPYNEEENYKIIMFSILFVVIILFIYFGISY
jgi:serine/threonine protein kinase